MILSCRRRQGLSVLAVPQLWTLCRSGETWGWANDVILQAQARGASAAGQCLSCRH